MIGGIEGLDVRCPSGAANAATDGETLGGRPTDGETLGGRPDALESENAVVKTTVPFHRTSSEHALIMELIAEIERRNNELWKNRSRILNDGDTQIGCGAGHEFGKVRARCATELSQD